MTPRSRSGTAQTRWRPHGECKRTRTQQRQQRRQRQLKLPQTNRSNLRLHLCTINSAVTANRCRCHFLTKLHGFERVKKNQTDVCNTKAHKASESNAICRKREMLGVQRAMTKGTRAERRGAKATSKMKSKEEGKQGDRPALQMSAGRTAAVLQSLVSLPVVALPRVYTFCCATKKTKKCAKMSEKKKTPHDGHTMPMTTMHRKNTATALRRRMALDS